MTEEEESSSSPQRIILDFPDDFHHHVRDGTKTKYILQHATKRFGRAIIMPNTKPPITTTELALKYHQHIIDSLPSTSITSFEPLMTLYLTDNTTSEMIHEAYATGKIYACKYYPAGATTNSDYGVSDVTKTYGALKAMEDVGMMLCIHSEVTHADIFEREPVFIEEVMKPLVAKFPKLKMVMEHISTKEAVDYIMNEAPDTVKASMTCHHLLYNRNHLLVGGIRPHLYCLPILKAEKHRVALLDAATSGSNKFFLGTDSAPHDIFSKETSCGCAGVFTAHAAIELYAEAFERNNALHLLNDFVSKHGCEHYGLSQNPTGNKLILEKKSWIVPDHYEFGEGRTLTPLRAGEEILWKIVNEEEE